MLTILRLSITSLLFYTQLLLGFLILTMPNAMLAEQSTFFEDDAEDEQDQISGNDVIEHWRIVAKEYPEMGKEEKKTFLIESEFTEEEVNDFIALSKLDWKSGGQYKLPKSNSTLSLSDNYILVTGEDAVSIYSTEGDPDSLEALVIDVNDFETPILFHYFDVGYLPTHDWNEFDSKKFIGEVIKGAKEGNKERLKKGKAEFQILAWHQEPILDKQTNTIYCAAECFYEDKKVVSSFIVRPGREGFELIAWASTNTPSIAFDSYLEPILRGHSFDPGYRYEDYKQGDKVVAYSLAALTASTVIGKVAKVGSYKFLKRLALYVVTFPIVFYVFRRIFRRFIKDKK